MDPTAEAYGAPTTMDSGIGLEPGPHQMHCCPCDP